MVGHETITRVPFPTHLLGSGHHTAGMSQLAGAPTNSSTASWSPSELLVQATSVMKQLLIIAQLMVKNHYYGSWFIIDFLFVIW